MDTDASMPEVPKLQHPWLVAVWPGMGNVALSAGYYLMAKLGMHQLAEFSPRELFDLDHVEVKKGVIRPGRLPRSRIFVWKDPDEKRDLLVFLGEAQPPMGKYAFCMKLIAFARHLGAERIITFAAMATQMHPEHASRVFAAATEAEMLDELNNFDLELLEEGHIGGLNGLLLCAAAEAGLRGICLLGEMPHLFAQLPFPKASLAVLEAFASVVGIEMDLTELSEQAAAVNERLGELLAKIETAMEERHGFEPETEQEEHFGPEPTEESRITPDDENEIERLFAKAKQDRSKAYELKRKLDALGVFKDYEDRFLDLFKQA